MDSYGLAGAECKSTIKEEHAFHTDFTFGGHDNLNSKKLNPAIFLL